MSSLQEQLNEEQLRAIYAWIDAIPLSRPKKNIARDFSDGVMLAEVVAAYFPALVEIHNYPAANNLKQKIYNHETLNNRVLKKFGYTLSRETIEDIVNAKAGVIEVVLNNLQIKMAKYREKKQGGSESQSPSSQGGNSSAGNNKVVKKSEYNNYMDDNHSAAHGNKLQQYKNKLNDIAASVDEELLLEKEQQIRELQETVEILELKVAKLEQLVRLKDNKIAKLLITIQRALETADLQQENLGLRRGAIPVAEPIGRSRLMEQLRASTVRLAPHKTAVFITGESGAGKEVLARYLHQHSPRADPKGERGHSSSARSMSSG
jgi:transcriptional regulator with GAF, ATPase, and Fis domain